MGYSERVMSEEQEVEPATANDTVDAIADSTQRDAFPLRRAFLQQKRGGKSAPGPLASFVAAGDRTGLLLYCLAVTKASKSPWDVSLHSAVWARALGLADPTGQAARGRISKTWTRPVDRNDNGRRAADAARGHRARRHTARGRRDWGSASRRLGQRRGWIELPRQRHR